MKKIVLSIFVVFLCIKLNAMEIDVSIKNSDQEVIILEKDFYDYFNNKIIKDSKEEVVEKSKVTLQKQFPNFGYNLKTSDIDICNYNYDNNSWFKDINSVDEYGDTALMYAVRHDSLNKISKLLINNGANVNIQDKIGCTALMLASANKNIEMVKLLIEKGADVNNANICEYTSLRYAVANNNLEIAKLLIENGADVNIKDQNRRTVLMYAVATNNLEMVKLLIDNDMANKIKVNVKDVNGCTALIYSVINNKQEMVELLLYYGADVNIQDNNGYTALMCAVYNDNLGITKLLLENGANVNHQNNDEYTALMYVNKSNLEMVNLLNYYLIIDKK